MIELHEYGSHEVHKALKLARYLEEAGAETREEKAIVELAIELQKAVSRGDLEAASWAQTLRAFKARRPEPSSSAREVLDALTRFCGQCDDDSEPPTCFACGTTCALQPGDEPTPLCHSCAHEAVCTLANELSVWEELWRNVHVHVDEFPAHVELKAKVAQLEGERDALCAEVDALGERENRLARQLQAALNTLESAVLEIEAKNAHASTCAHCGGNPDLCGCLEVGKLQAQLTAATETAQRRRPPAVHRGEGYRVIVELDERDSEVKP